jgi:hypothetical protein
MQADVELGGIAFLPWQRAFHWRFFRRYGPVNFLLV